MLSFYYRTHAVETEKGNCNVQDQKWAETNYKTCEIEKKRKSWRQNCVIGVVERSLSQSQILKGIKDKPRQCPNIFLMVIRDELIDY